MEKGRIEGAIQTAFDFGQTKEYVINYIAKNYNLSYSEAEKLVDEYDSKAM